MPKWLGYYNKRAREDITNVEKKNATYLCSSSTCKSSCLDRYYNGNRSDRSDVSNMSNYSSSGDPQVSQLLKTVSAYFSQEEHSTSLKFKRTDLHEYPYMFRESPLSDEAVGRTNLFNVNDSSSIISQNSSNRKVHRYIWKNPKTASLIPVAVKFVADKNNRDGRSLKREIECHMYTRVKLFQLFENEKNLWNNHRSLYSYTKMPEWVQPETIIDAWPSSEIVAYYLNKKVPGQSVLVTRKLSGPDFFDVIRTEHNHAYTYHVAAENANQVTCTYMNSIKPNQSSILSRSTRSLRTGLQKIKELTHNGHLKTLNKVKDRCDYYPLYYDYYKIRWAAITLKRLAQFHSINVRHNDVKPDNIVCDFHEGQKGNQVLDVKLIDLGTASLAQSKDFTGGTSWYESPEQKLLEYFSKKKRDATGALQVNIDLSSDIWGMGISLSELLVGRRVVDAMKKLSNCKPLEYIGRYESIKIATGNSYNYTSSLIKQYDYYGCGGDYSNYPYWQQDPTDWVNNAKLVLFDKKPKNRSLATIAASWLFDRMVLANPLDRISALSALDVVEQFAEEEYRRIRYNYTSFSAHTDSYAMPVEHKF